MPDLPGEHDGKRALRDHVLDRARIARAKFGPEIGGDSMLRLLDDREIVRYPVAVRFDALGLQPGEFAHAEQVGAHPREGFTLFVHPLLRARPDALPLVMAYHVPPINYGDIAEPEDCEAFGAALLNLPVAEYYRRLCEIADSLG